VNRQGNDIGTSYRSAIYYTSDAQREVALDTIKDVDASGLWPGAVVTEVEPVGDFWAGRARAPGLPRAHPQRLHVPLPASELGVAAPTRVSRLSQSRPRVPSPTTRLGQTGRGGCDVSCSTRADLT
jgi:hypothetical protein